MKINRPTSHKQHASRGRAIVIVIVCMGIATTIMMTSLQMAIRVRRQMRTEIQMEQTRWMLKAASQRALNKLSEDPDYTGENWDVGKALTLHDDATIQIKVEANEDGRKIISATSRIGSDDNPVTATRRSGRWSIDSDQTE